jgi:hypothetical protein
VDLHLTNDQILVLGTIFAFVAALGAVSAVIVQLVLRYRDRRDVTVTKVEVAADSLVVHFRNSGGSPTIVNGVRLIVIGGPPPDAATIGGKGIKLAGRDDGWITCAGKDLRGQCPEGSRIGIAAVEDTGKVSKPFELPADALAWLREPNEEQR